jgi:hypothetical protein
MTHEFNQDVNERTNERISLGWDKHYLNRS